jgi:hypothetical protein
MTHRESRRTQAGSPAPAGAVMLPALVLAAALLADCAGMGSGASPADAITIERIDTAHAEIASAQVRETPGGIQVRGRLPPDGLAPGDSLLCPGRPLRGRLRHERAAPQPLGLRHPLREGFDGVSDALCMSPPLASGLPPLRHCGDTLALRPAGDYAPRASHFPGAQRTTGTYRRLNPKMGLSEFTQPLAVSADQVRVVRISHHLAHDAGD